MAERRTLKMHPRLLWDVIHRQAGSVPKAVLEGVMNTVDAGASRCDVTFDRGRFTIVDDGKGFTDETEIHDFFETFGHPHEEGDARYGRFRMGRGQMFAFGLNRWATNNFRMTVDLKPQKDEKGKEYALGYDFEKVKEPVKGCRIECDLYEQLTPSATDAAIREITDYVKFVDIPVTLNGKLISEDPKKTTWDVETDDAFIKMRQSGDLYVYNMGVLVCRYPSYRFGVGGVVASKTALDVNFARNDVQSSCKVWKRIERHLRGQAAEKAEKTAPLTQAERENLAIMLAQGELSVRDFDARVLTDVTGSHHNFSRLRSLSHFADSISVAAKGDLVGEMAHTRRLAFVVTQEFAALFNATTATELVEALKGVYERSGVNPPKMVPVEMEQFHSVISSKHEPLKDKELNPAERLVLKALRECSKTLVWRGRGYDKELGSNIFHRGVRERKTQWGTTHEVSDPAIRRVNAGVSETAHAWTNGTTDIWFDRKTLAWAKDGIPGINRLVGVLIHEYLHNGPDTGTHEHGVDFYQRFHDLALRTSIIGEVTNEILKSMTRTLRAEGKVLPHFVRTAEDKVAGSVDLGIGSPETDEERFVDEEEAVERAWAETGEAAVPAAEDMPIAAVSVSAPLAVEASEPAAAAVPQDLAAPRRERRKARAEADEQLAPRLPGL